MSNTWYTVVETVETIYNTDLYGKRYPSDYSVFTVINGDSDKPVQAFSALEHGLEDAEYMANELRDKLNKALPKAQSTDAAQESIVETPSLIANVQAEIVALIQANAKLEAERDALQLSVHGLQAKLDKHSHVNLKLSQENADLKREKDRFISVVKEAYIALSEQDDNRINRVYFQLETLANTPMSQEALQSKPEQAPQESKVTLPNEVIEVLAKNYDSPTNWGIGMKLQRWESPIGYQKQAQFFGMGARIYSDDNLVFYPLKKAFRTEANIAAIEAKRQELGLA